MTSTSTTTSNTQSVQLNASTASVSALTSEQTVVAEPTSWEVEKACAELVFRISSDIGTVLLKESMFSGLSGMSSLARPICGSLVRRALAPFKWKMGFRSFQLAVQLLTSWEKLVASLEKK